MQAAAFDQAHGQAQTTYARPRGVLRGGRRLRTALVWGGLGFITGAVFWHAVGFWDFMSAVVLNSGPDTELVRIAAARQQPGADELPTIYLVDPRSCTALELDRSANRTAVRPCPSDGLSLRLQPLRSREDLAVLTP
jgi:hypothetical protein